MGAYKQDFRPIQIFTPLGEDVLLLQRFDGHEGISSLFQFNLQMHSENRNITFDSIVGKKATIKITLPTGKERYINGLISRFSQGGSTMMEGGTTPKIYAHYNATLVPWLWMLTRTTDCRIFQNQSVPDIIKTIFQEYGFNDFDPRLQGTYEPREYCVQYRETSYNFVSRLMEEEGIFYFFEHQEDKHVLVMADSPGAFKPTKLHPSVSYKTIIGLDKDEDVITEMTIGKEVRPGKYTVNDFNFELPKIDLTANVSGKDARKFEVYDYPGEYRTKGEGERLAGIRMQEEETPTTVVTGSSTCRGFAPGFTFDLKDHYRRDLNKTYLIKSLYHTCDLGASYRSDIGAEDFLYVNQYEFVPHPTPYRPVRVTPIPIVHGSQTAIVVGPPGEEIYVDKYGRVKVQFHWDRFGKYNDKSSCWIRVSQNWAGKQWGAMFIPRIGQEVIVDFLEGDPDRPLITGRVYNAGSMPPYTLPDEKTKSTIKTYSYKGGGGFNELRFEDKKGSEQVFIHAEKNMDFRVKNDYLTYVGNEQHTKVKRDRLTEIGADDHLTIQTNSTQKNGGSISRHAQMNIQEKAGMKYAMDAGMEVHIKSGMTLTIETGVNLTLKVGGNFININPAGVFIQGTMVLINSGGAAGSGSGSNPETPKTPKEADTAEPGQKAELPPPKQPPKPQVYSPGAIALKKAARDGMPFCDM
ncbi:MAG: type VI secretion system tip protein VgrG [Acidobacteriota bacterium]